MVNTNYSISGCLGVDVDRADASLEFSLGDHLAGNDGAVFVYCSANGAVTANDVCLLPQDWDADALDTTNSASALGEKVGVGMGTLTDNQYGWFMICGTHDSINVGSSAAANAQLNSTATAGRIDDDATTGSEDVERLFLTTAESSGNTAPGVLTHPTVGATN